MDHAPVTDLAPLAETPQTAPAEAAATCPFPHGSAATPEPIPTDLATTVAVDEATPDAARCPVPHGLATLAPGCPVPHGATARPVHRSKADEVVRRVLRVKERPAGVSSAAAYQAFQKSMLISATRCTLTYVIFPFVLPAVGFAAQGAVGVLVGVLAMVCDVFTIRRFFSVDHKYRWYFSAIVFGIMCLLTALLIQDISHLAGHGSA